MTSLSCLVFVFWTKNMFYKLGASKDLATLMRKRYKDKYLHFAFYGGKRYLLKYAENAKTNYFLTS